ncbi:MAG: acyl-CoA dehydrogenase family protein, partial [Pseudomonadota bacterium]|nr:acyl-CoA dehydrogenase family protein [Pseudomonadota bacterium]
AAAAGRARAGAAAAAGAAARLLVYRVVDDRARGLAPGPESNIARAAVVAAEHAVADFGMDFLPEAFAGDGLPFAQAHHERAIVAGIAAGAAEIQLNLIASRHLNLPREVA